MPSRKSSSTVPLQRGAACLSCRKRKLKCDSGRPVCRQCTKMNRADECHYDEKRQKSRTQKLKERLSMLEERIRELESEPGTSSLVSSASDAPSPSSSTESRPYGGELHLTHPNYNGNPSWDASPGSSGSSLTPSVYHGSSSSVGPFSYDDMHNLEMSPFTLPYSSFSHWNGNEPLPDDTKQHLLTIFLHHRHKCAWISDISRFLGSFTPEPHPALMSAVFLLACHFEQSRSRFYTEIGEVFLSKALHEINVALDKSDRLVDIVQASCLLAVYFYLNSRTLEGYCHSFSAARLAVELGLHQVRPPNSAEPPHPAPTLIAPPMNETEFRERVATFWQVFVVDRFWSVASGLPAALPDVSRRLAVIKTPWPKPMSLTYRAPSIYQNQAQVVEDMTFLPYLRAKAAVLFERSARLAASTSRGSDYWEDYHATNSALELFNANMPMFVGYEAWRQQAPFIDVELFTVHTIIYAASLDLQDGFVELHSCQAANSILSLIRQMSDSDYEFLDPIVSACWLKLARIYLRGLSDATVHYMSGNDPYAINVLEQELSLILNAVHTLSRYCPLAAEHARKIEQEHSALLPSYHVGRT